METLNVKFTSFAGEDGQNVLVVREGAALPLREPNAVNITGDIRSVATFLNLRKNNVVDQGFQEVIPGRALIYTDKKNLTIVYNGDPQNVYGTIIKGILEESEELKKFAINTQTVYTKDQFLKLVRFNKVFFVSGDAHESLVSGLQKFTASTSGDITNNKDNRGNKVEHFGKQVTTDLPLEFTLRIPIFNGEDYCTFRVELGIDITENSTRFYLESVELHEQKQILLESIFATQLKACEGLVIINK